MNRFGLIAFCLFSIFVIAYLAGQAHVFAQQNPEPTSHQAVYAIELDKVLLKVGETTNARVSLLTAEGCTFGSAHFVMEVIDENIEESDALQIIAGGSRPLPNSASSSIWQAQTLGSFKLYAYSFGEGACQPDPATPAPFFHASASGVSQGILIVDHIYESFLPIAHFGP